ncbi:YlbF family regulator [Herbivorax sp. ANBcel31]|uniref:YlbF family regulator n=1 Tax=Herbivorax sp. ANBcel31 TaxID=3069754 RepID=UPI0027ADB86B|nr:YlbF family regulator [Herbivorax sp. ANBcel31]MDQ2087006.1 YlbF family regulator [Herbivorax sp. ANBcel31]
MEILSKAKELGTMIGTSEQMSSFKKWEADLERDHKARAILREYQTLQTEMVRAAHEDAEKEILDQIKEKLVVKFDEVSNCDITRNYLESKDKLDNLIKKVNDVLVYSITGDDPCSQEKCGSCGGGCG